MAISKVFVIGAGTISAMNIPVAERILQVRLNLERWRWLPENLGTRHVRVNIADFRAELIDASDTLLNMKVIVGKEFRKTPVFSDRMTFLVFCPYWNVPNNIAVQDLLPAQKKDSL